MPTCLDEARIDSEGPSKESYSVTFESLERRDAPQDVKPERELRIEFDRFGRVLFERGQIVGRPALAFARQKLRPVASERQPHELFFVRRSRLQRNGADRHTLRGLGRLALELLH
jgi:hypothetical protein